MAKLRPPTDTERLDWLSESADRIGLHNDKREKPWVLYEINKEGRHVEAFKGATIREVIDAGIRPPFKGW